MWLNSLIPSLTRSFLFFSLMVSTVSSEVLSNLAIYDPNFLGREEIIEKIHDCLKKKKTISLYGIPGIGKSATARKYAELFRGDYDIIWIFNCKIPLDSQLQSLALFLKKQKLIQENIDIKDLSVSGGFKKLFKALKRLKILLILDDVKEFGDVKVILFNLNRGDNHHVLMTSKKKPFQIDHIALPLLSEKNSQLLFKKIAKTDDKTSEDISKHLFKAPIVIRQAAEHISSGFISGKSYLQHLKNKGEALKNRERKFISKNKQNLPCWDQAHDSAEIVLRVFIEDVLQEVPESRFLLEILPFLHNQNVSRKFIERCLQVGFGLEGFLAQESISALSQFNILLGNSSSAQNNFYFHEVYQSLVPQMAKDWNQLKRRFAEFLVHELYQKSENRIKHLSNQSEVLAHATKFCTTIESSFENRDVLRIRVAILFYQLYVLRDHKSALLNIEKIEKIRKNIGMDQKLKSDYVMSKGDVSSLYNVSNAEKMDKLLEEMLDVYNFFKTNRGSPDEKLRILNSIIQNLLLRMNKDKAVIYVLEADKIVGDVRDKSILVSYAYFKTWFYLFVEQFDKANEQADIGMSLIRNQPRTAINFYIQNMKAEALLRLERPEEAIQYAEFSYQSCREYFGDRKMDVAAEALTYLALSLHKLNKSEKAEYYIKKSIDYYAEVYGAPDKSLDQVEALIIYGDILQKQEKKKKSLEVYKNALVAARNLLQSFDNVIIKRIYEKIIKISMDLEDYDISGAFIKKYEKSFGAWEAKVPF